MLFLYSKQFYRVNYAKKKGYWNCGISADGIYCG